MCIVRFRSVSYSADVQPSVLTSARTKKVDEVLYFRLIRAGHRARWREAVQDPLLEFEPVSAALN